jgi:hypothetical protein
VAREGPNWRQFNGGLDEIRLWGVARTAAEIQAAMNTQLTGSAPGLRAYWRLNDGFGLTATDDLGTAPGTLGLGPLWVAGGGIDLTAPNIIGIATSNITDTSVTISFQTSEVAEGRVAYSTTGACPCVEVVTPAGTAHSVTLTGLAPATLHSFYVQAIDGADNVQTSAWQSVATLVAGADGVAPVVTITQPPTSIVSGSVSITATATDAGGVISGQVLVDGVPLGEVLATAPPYSAVWDTTTVADGLHTITVQAVDASGNVGAASVSVTVRNTPDPQHHLSFDGIDDHVTVADAPSLSFGTGAADTPFTAELWFQPTVMSGRRQLIGKWGESNQQEYKLTIINGAVVITLRDESTQGYAVANTTGSLTGLAGGWHHLAVTYDGRGGPTAANGLTIYVDGVAVPLLRETSPGYVAMENLAAPLEVAREGPNWRQFAGGLDEIRLWGVARTAAEIQAAMSVELTGAEPGLRAYWQLNEGSGLTATDAAGTAPGTLGAGTLWLAGGAFVP